MQETFLAVRAIGSEFARRLWVGVAITALAVMVVAIALLVWLTGYSPWWWLLAVPIGVGLSVGMSILIVFWLLLRRVRPPQTSTQKQQVRQFVDTLSNVSEVAGTPRVILLVRVIRSIAAPRSDPYLENIQRTKNVVQDFLTISKTFAKK